MENFTLQALKRGLINKDFSSVELTQYYLTRINKHKNLNCFITICEEQAIAQAQEADRNIAKAKIGMLTGIPMSLKDIFCTRGIKTSCGSKMLDNFIAPYDATIYHKLKAQGGVLLGKNNMDEFGMGSSNEHSYYGAVRNPWNLAHVSGGSSGGSAAAVAASLTPFSVGSDTGGSVRQPASFCGVSGLKPTYGLVSRFGMVAYASSMDQAGPLARSAEDLAFVLQILAGFDPKDSRSVDQIIPNYNEALTKEVKNLRIGIPTCFFEDLEDPNLAKIINDAVDVFKTLGATIIPIDLKLHQHWIPCYYVVACAEASSNLSRFDGIRYGHRTKVNFELSDLIRHSRSEGFGSEVKRRILTGTHVLSSGYFDAYYLQALKVRRLIQAELIENLKQVDLLLGPTTPSTAFLLGESLTPVQSYLADIFTVAVNLAGLPALSIPAGFSKNLPVGMQMIGSPFGEAYLLQVAHLYQQNTDWHLRVPEGIAV